MITDTNNPVTTLEKLARKALNPATAPDAASSAWNKVLELAREHELTYDTLNGVIGDRLKLLNVLDYRMPLGKYNGISIYLVYLIDREYLGWALREMNCRDILKAKIRKVIQAFEESNPNPDSPPTNPNDCLN